MTEIVRSMIETSFALVVDPIEVDRTSISGGARARAISRWLRHWSSPGGTPRTPVARKFALLVRTRSGWWSRRSRASGERPVSRVRPTQVIGLERNG